MAKRSEGELELLLRGAAAIAEMKDLGIDDSQLEGIISGGVEKIQRGQRRREDNPGFAFNKPFRKETEVVIQDGKAKIQPKGDNTELRATEQRDLDPFGRERRNSQGRVIRQYKKPGATPDRPEVTEAYVNAVVKRLAEADVGLQEADLVRDDFGQRTLEGK